MEGSPVTVRIELFDGLRVVCGEASTAQFRTQKTGGLLAYLAYHHPRQHRRDVLTELLWADLSPEAGRRSLSTELWALRQALIRVGAASKELIRTEGGLVGLSPTAVATDVAEFGSLMRAAGRGIRRGTRVTELMRAVELYRGELLRGYYDDWIYPERTRVEGLYQHALSELISELEASGDVRRAIQYASQALTANWQSEAACLRLMRLTAAVGDHTAALTYYEEYERQLRRELELDPGDEIRRLARDLAGRVRAAPVIAALAGHSPARSQEIPCIELWEGVGGVVPLGSPSYVERSSDIEFRNAILAGHSVVLVKGPRQSGKSSVLARGLQAARAAGSETARMDLDHLDDTEFATSGSFYLALAERLAEQLGLPARPQEVWEADRIPSLNFRSYLRKEVLGHFSGPFVWAIDNVDRLFTRPFGGDALNLFRSWHNERAMDPRGPWGQLTLALAYATEVHLYLTDLNQSPFNVGTRVLVTDFSPEQVAELGRVLGAPCTEGAAARLMAVLGGHPFLVRRALYEMGCRKRPAGDLLGIAAEDTGPFGDHLRQMLAAVSQVPVLLEAVRALAKRQSKPDEESFLRLRSAGVLSGHSAEHALFRCPLYARYFQRRLL
jgi:DNA-binding SARP family transcriptional activator